MLDTSGSPDSGRNGAFYQILGPLVIGGDQPLLLPKGHTQQVLSVLLINANRPVSTSDLLRAIWGDTDTETDQAQLYKCISVLRAALDQRGHGDDLATIRRFGYQLTVAEPELDRLQFDRLVLAAESADSASQPDRQAVLLRQALALWRGQHALDGVPNDALRLEVAELELHRKRAAIRLFELEFTSGRFGQIIPQLTTIATYYPTDRRLCELLMLALNRDGHIAEALMTYDRYVSALRRGNGTDPDSALRTLRYAISRADEPAISQYEASARLGVGLHRPFVVPRQLPPDIGDDLVGRDDPMAELTWLLQRTVSVTPVLVINGPGGMGKTALAVRVAHAVRARYPDGQLFLELRGTSAQPLRTDEALAQILRAFNVQSVPDDRAERVALYRSLVAQRRVLLVLDDVADEAQVRALVPADPGCVVLITSRNRLTGLAGAHHVPTLRPLDGDSAVELYRRLIRRGGLDPASDPEPAIWGLVDLCAGLPLALCVAAALRTRNRERGLADFVTQLARQKLDGLTYGEHSVQHSIGAGFDLLDDDSRGLFLGLGVLQQPEFSAWTAAALLDGVVADPVEVLLRLASCHMIEPCNIQPATPAGSGVRFRFHDLTAEYAQRRAHVQYAIDDIRLIVQRAYSALLTLTRRAHHNLYRGDFELVHGSTPSWPAPPSILAELDRDCLTWFETERNNIRAAVRQTAMLGLAELSWDLAVSAHEFYGVRGYLDDWHETHITALAACRGTDQVTGHNMLVVSLGQPAMSSSRRSGVPGATRLARAVDSFRRVGELHGQAIALRTLGNALRRVGKRDEALSMFAEAVPLYERSGDLVGQWQALRYIGQTHLDRGEVEAALNALRQAQEVAIRVDSQRPLTSRLLAQTAYWVGQAQLTIGQLDQARANFEFVLATVEPGDDTGRGYALQGLGEVAQRTGALRRAQQHLAAGLDLATRGDDTVLAGRIQLCLAEVHRANGHADDETAALAQAAECFRAGHTPGRQAHALAALGAAHARRGDVAQARVVLSDAVALYAGMGAAEAGPVAEQLAALPA